MRFVSSIWTLLLSLALLVTACQTAQIPNVRICKEIPFVDAPEGACIWTVTHKQELIGATEWANMRPYMLMLDDGGWKDIKTEWLQACQMADSCNITVDSVDTLIQNLDAIASTILSM